MVIDRDFQPNSWGEEVKACLSLGLEEIPVRFYDELDELTAREIELEENIRRKQFTWQEEVLAKAEIDASNERNMEKLLKAPGQKRGGASEIQLEN